MKVIIDFYQQHIFKLNCYDVDVGIIEGVVDVAPQDIYVENEPQDSNGFSWWQDLSQSHLGVDDLVDGFMVELIGNEDVKQEILEPCLLVHDIGAVSPLRGHLHSSYPIDSWVKPADGFVKVNCHGSVYVNEGRAGFGCVLRDSSGRWIFGCSGLVVGTCVLRTELWAIWRGLYMALQQNQTAVECETDSVDAFYLVNHCQIPQEQEEKELIRKVFELKVRPGWNVTFNLIHRGANRVADWMAKLGARANGVAIDWIHPPNGLQQLLELDNS
ncbi:hypothetical protein PIB30_117357 [Stylosanthes scabra]|uniref:RNase H type-1 domain-containing protein n=1 Tax=Stylosanthes scabra TaxID=79078 RepID=A0ABU6QEC8_9FABA|nr:hypothetical protein [Stylosanthes scabra]